MQANLILRPGRQLDRLDRPRGKRSDLARVERPTAEAPGGLHPITTFARSGVPGDPLNVQITATAAQLCAAFATAGWYRADEITLATALHIAFGSVFGRAYVSAPVSNLYLFGRRQDYAYERPSKNVRARDHVRFWDTGQRSFDGRPIWIGAATKDIQVGLSKATHLPTHKIAWDTDTERMILVSDLAATGWVVREGWAPSTGTPIWAFNAQGDRYSADGEMATLVLADIWAPPLLLRVCRQLGRQVLQRVARALLRWRLPRRGGERAVR